MNSKLSISLSLSDTHQSEYILSLSRTISPTGSLSHISPLLSLYLSPFLIFSISFSPLLSLPSLSHLICLPLFSICLSLSSSKILTSCRLRLDNTAWNNTSTNGHIRYINLMCVILRIYYLVYCKRVAIYRVFIIYCIIINIF